MCYLTCKFDPTALRQDNFVQVPFDYVCPGWLAEPIYQRRTSAYEDTKMGLIDVRRKKYCPSKLQYSVQTHAGMKDTAKTSVVGAGMAQVCKRPMLNTARGLLDISSFRIFCSSNGRARLAPGHGSCRTTGGDKIA